MLLCDYESHYQNITCAGNQINLDNIKYDIQVETLLNFLSATIQYQQALPIISTLKANTTVGDYSAHILINLEELSDVGCATAGFMKAAQYLRASELAIE